MAAAPIFLFTDFGSTDIYIGQVKAVLHDRSPDSAVVDLANDLPAFAVACAAHLLAALAARLPAGAVTLCIVDPGVGSARRPAAIHADERWYVGPDNGLMSVVAARAAHTQYYELQPLDVPVCASFHGRDFFAPHAALLASGEHGRTARRARERLDVELAADDLEQIVYIDHYGNAITGMRATAVSSSRTLALRDRSISRARVFSDVPVGDLFWYENSIGLVEIAANQANAARMLSASIGDRVLVVN